ncbi:riboflavin kinase [Blyttiomyces sp. JEL0837]|nr:riboflavin kinase [Blyttiomyces sp. JEL0837]
MSDIKTARPLLAGGDSPESPYPVFLKGEVSKGFGRGSKELGVPTANLPEDVAENAGKVIETGILYGWSSVGSSSEVWPMVMSFGWNPFYKNEKRSAEVHILHSFPSDFYGEELRVVVLGYIRPEKNYDSLDALIEDINIDISVAKNSLARPAYLQIKEHEFLKPSSK